jgi:hypothetical protein
MRKIRYTLLIKDLSWRDIRVDSAHQVMARGKIGRTMAGMAILRMGVPLYTFGRMSPNIQKRTKQVFATRMARPARVFSSLDKSTTDLHFQWMKEYGVDGVFMQLFFAVAREHDTKDKPNDVLLRNALNAAQKYSRATAVMYDLSFPLWSVW